MGVYVISDNRDYHFEELCSGEFVELTQGLWEFGEFPRGCATRLWAGHPTSRLYMTFFLVKFLYYGSLKKEF